MPAADDRTEPRPSALWLWSDATASSALNSRDLAVIFRAYRTVTGVNQSRLAMILGYDKTYISMIENRRRTISDVTVLRRIASTLGIPAHVLGVAENDGATHAAMAQFAESVIRLADLARRSGHTAEAVEELWPVVARLETRAADGALDRSLLDVLARARIGLGVALGTILPEERLATAATWTGRGLRVAHGLGDPVLLVNALTMHGNELRKVGWTGAALVHLRRAAEIAGPGQPRSAALSVLARTAGDHGDVALFDRTVAMLRQEIDRLPGTMLSGEFAVREVRLRGLVATARSAAAGRLLEREAVTPSADAPLWRVIERITVADVILSAQRDRPTARYLLLHAVADAERLRLPHQIQRALRLARANAVADVIEASHEVLARLQARLRESEASGNNPARSHGESTTS